MPDNDDTFQADLTDGAATAPQDGAPAAPQDGAPAAPQDGSPEPESPAPKKAARKTAKKAAAKKTAKRAAAKKAAPEAGVEAGVEAVPDGPDAPDAPGGQVEVPANGTAGTSEDEPEGKPAKKAAKKTAKRAAKKSAKKAVADTGDTTGDTADTGDTTATADGAEQGPGETGASGAPAVLFQPPEKPATAKKSAGRRRPAKQDAAEQPAEAGDTPESSTTSETRETSEIPETPETPEGGTDEPEQSGQGDDSDEEGGESGNRRRRRRGGRRRRKPGGGSDGEEDGDSSSTDDATDSQEDDRDSDEDNQGGESAGSRRRRRRRRAGDDGDSSSQDDPEKTVTRVRKQRNPEDEITSIGGSTRLEAKKQRRREGREAGRRRAPIVSEAEFLARRESVERVMAIRQRDDLTQIAVLEDKVLVEHYVARESQTSLIGNVYLGRVQNVLPSMEAAFIDIGKGRNAVLYAGEVNWSALGHKDGQPRKIESVLSSGQTVLVQVTKDPVGHKGARLTGQVSLPGRFLVYVPEGNTSGISRKLPDTERNRLKTLLKEIVPDSAGVIVRTAAEGASEDELTRDVERLTARWNDIEEKVKAGKGPQLLYGEPDLTLKVVRDLFTEDFSRLVIQGEDAWDLVDNYVSHVAPDLRDRLERFGASEGSEGSDGSEGSEGSDGSGGSGGDLFASLRIDEQIAKGLERKVWLPSGGSLIIDRTEAMTVVDVNTGKFTGSGGNLEETVTKNNLEAAEEIVRQLRLRDIGGIIVVDFIDMVLESNRDLVLRRLVECLGRDRTRHQVAEVTSLGLVQMTRKRIGTGLLEAFSTECEHCKGRGLLVHEHPIEQGGRGEDDEPRGRRARGGRNRRGAGSTGSTGGGTGGGRGNGGSGNGNGGGNGHTPTPADLAASRPPQKQSEEEHQDESAPSESGAQASGQSGVGTPAVTTAEPIEVPSHTGSVDGARTAEVSEPAKTAETAEATGAAVDAQAADGVAPSDASESAQPVQSVQPPEEPSAPRVVTRRRSARRPAGPPAASEETTIPGAGTQASPGAEPVAVPVEPGESDESEDAEESEESSGFSLSHVPVKRKGRKR